MDFTIKAIDSALLPAFRPYLMPQAAQALEDGDEDLIALGVVTGEGHTCGALAATLFKGDATLFSLFIDPTVRRQGTASQLLIALLEHVGPTGRVWAEWILPEEDFTAVSALLSVHGFSYSEPAEPVYRLTSDSLVHTPVLRGAFSPTFRPDRNVLPYCSLASEQVEELLGDANIPHFLRPDTFDRDGLITEMSLCYVYGGRVTAYLLIGVSTPGECVILASFTRRGAHPAAFLQVVAAALAAGLTRFGGSFTCWLDAVNPTAEELARRLSGGLLVPWWTGNALRQPTVLWKERSAP